MRRNLLKWCLVIISLCAVTTIVAAFIEKTILSMNNAILCSVGAILVSIIFVMDRKKNLS